VKRLEITVSNTLSVVLTKEIKGKLNALTKRLSTEIGGWLAGEVKDGVIRVDDLLIPKQEVSAAAVDIDPGDMVKLVKEYGKRTERIVGHWHSHNSMKAFWSATDETLMKEKMEPPEQQMFLFIVTGEKGESYKSRIEFNCPHGSKMRMEDVSVKVEAEAEDEVLNAWCDKTFKEKVKEKVFVPTNWALTGTSKTSTTDTVLEDINFSFNKKAKNLIMSSKNKELDEEIAAYLTERGVSFEVKEYTKTTQYTMYSYLVKGVEIGINKEIAAKLEEEITCVLDVFYEEIEKMDLTQKLMQDRATEEGWDFDPEYDPKTADIYPRENYNIRSYTG